MQMADDYGDKTEDPTPRKRQEAREQGKVARSRDLATAVLIIGSMVLPLLMSCETISAIARRDSFPRSS